MARRHPRAVRGQPPPLAAAMRYQAGLSAWLAEYQAELLTAALATYHDPLGRVPTRRQDARLPRLPRLDPPKPPIGVIDRASADVVAHVDKGMRRVYEKTGYASQGATYLGRAPVGSALAPVETRRVKTISLRQAAPKVNAQLPVFRDRNVELIKSIPENLHEDVQSLLDQAWFDGLHADAVKGLIQERFDVSDSRADLIARDQVLKLNASVTEARHKEAGISEYIWNTAGDERVREGHAALDGTRQSYDDPPDTGDGEANNPGEDISCRCFADPILPDYPDDENE